MGRYLLSRFFQMFITFILFMIFSFWLIQAPPGDITTQMKMNPKVTKTQIEREVQRLGLDKPVYVQFGRWATGFFRGDWGDSFQERKPVIMIVQERLPRTLVLFSVAFLVQFVLGFHLGRILAWKRGGWFEHSITLPSIFLYTAFYPWFGLLMILFFSVTLGWLPIGQFATPALWLAARIPTPEGVSQTNYIFNQMIFTTLIASCIGLIIFLIASKQSAQRRRLLNIVGPLVTLGGLILYWWIHPYGKYAWDIAYHLILPVLTQTAAGFAGTMLLMRTTMLETLREDYILTARAKGLADNMIRDKHAARNALLPVFTSAILSLPSLIGGGVFTETIFSWPGMGKTLVDATNNQDLPVAMAVFTIIGGLAILAHLVADIFYAYLDPRVRYG